MMLMGWGGELPVLMNIDSILQVLSMKQGLLFLFHSLAKKGVLPLICWVHAASFVLLVIIVDSLQFCTIGYKQNNYLPCRYKEIIFSNDTSYLQKFISCNFDDRNHISIPLWMFSVTVTWMNLFKARRALFAIVPWSVYIKPRSLITWAILYWGCLRIQRW